MGGRSKLFNIQEELVLKVYKPVWSPFPGYLFFPWTRKRPSGKAPKHHFYSTEGYNWKRGPGRRQHLPVLGDTTRGKDTKKGGTGRGARINSRQGQSNEGWQSIKRCVWWTTTVRTFRFNMRYSKFSGRKVEAIFKIQEELVHWYFKSACPIF